MIIVLILSCQKNAERRLNQTWAKHSFVYYVVGDPDMEEDYKREDNILYVKCEDDICHLPKKFICGLNVVNTLFEYKYVYVTEDDYMICKSTLFRDIYVAMEKYKGDYGGTNCMINEEKMAGAFKKHDDFPFTVMLKPCSYMKKGLIVLSHKSVLDLLSKREDIEKEYVCDYAIGYHLDKTLKRVLLNTDNFVLHWRKYLRKI